MEIHRKLSPFIRVSVVDRHHKNTAAVLKTQMDDFALVQNFSDFSFFRNFSVVSSHHNLLNPYCLFKLYCSV